VAAGLAAAGTWWFTDRAPYPYAQRALLNIPLPFLTSRRVTEILQPRPGERLLEIGPGTGLQSLAVAPRLGPDGRLDVLDIQQQMLDHVTQRAERNGIGSIVPARSDARQLPYGDDTFDAIYAITALGEIPDPERALQEAARVLAPQGRIVVGEFLDQHWLPFGRLEALADSCRLHLDARRGPAVAYLARFRPVALPGCTGYALG
jgi:ubiquinone/menaquinone biosynthesis C-methylase UbiE